MRAVLVLGGLLMVSGCGGGGTTGTNYSDEPPLAQIVATPTPAASATPVATATPDEVDATMAIMNASIENAAEDYALDANTL